MFTQHLVLLFIIVLIILNLRVSIKKKSFHLDYGMLQEEIITFISILREVNKCFSKSFQ